MNNPLGHKNLRAGNSGRENWILMFGLLAVFNLGFVCAVSWNSSANDNPYYFLEDENSYHNFTVNITDVSDFQYFKIFDVSWTEGSGSEHSDFAWLQWNDSGFENSTTGNLKINSSNNSETGNFTFNILVQGTGGGQTNYFNFIINATNDAPNFTNIESEYNLSQDDYFFAYINASDEEEHYPLVFNVTFIDNCTHAPWSEFADGENCSLFDFGFNLTSLSNSSAMTNFTPEYENVGFYWANVTVSDFGENYPCPHDYCDNSTYMVNQTSDIYLVKFRIDSVLAINVSNCTGQTLTEGGWLNCTINITTIGETDNVSVSSDSYFRNVGTSPHNSSWFKADEFIVAENFLISVNISILLTKREVGNWTVNFSADDAIVDEEVPRPIYESIYIFVNYTESGVVLDEISDLNGSSALYANYTFQTNATDEDLLIFDGSVKVEDLIFASNTSWVDVEELGLISGNDYITANISIDYDYALDNFGVGNYSILVNVTDGADNTDSKTFVVEILNDTAPEWNSTLDIPVNLNLTEGILFTYNVSINVSDEEGDPITFYYENVSAEFCSLNASTFNSTSGIISFTPVDCDVGYHNVTIIASDSKLNSSHEFNFTVNNIADISEIYSFSANNGSAQLISEGFNLKITESAGASFELVINDDDFLIPSDQRSFYNESLTISVSATNSTGSKEGLFNFSFVEFENPSSQSVSYNASFVPTGLQIDNYTIFVNITDNSSNSINRTFYLNVTEVLNDPVLETINNYSLTIHDYFNFTANATDDEDGASLNYSIVNLSVGSPNLTIGENNGSVEFDMNSNNSYAGAWQYNVTVIDSDGQTDFQIFYLYVYGNATLVLPTEESVFNLTENSLSILNFTINHSVADNLTYEFWIDSINCSYQNSSDCSYGNLTLRDITSSFGDGSVHNWSFTPNYTDESYFNYKNLTVSVYPNSTEINSTQRIAVMTNFSFKLNISHANYPIIIYDGVDNQAGTYGSTSINMDLSDNFRDYDYTDSYYLQNATFTINSSTSPSGIMAETYIAGNALTWDGIIEDWSLQLYSSSALEEFVTISANDSFSVATSDPFKVTFTAPVTTTVPTPTSGGGGSKTKLKHFSLKLVFPQDVIISDQNYIDVPFTIQNNGEFDLRGINLSSFVKFNNIFTDDVRISLGDNYIDELKFGQSEDFTMRIVANTQKSGKYEATIWADVSSPKFSDWGEFIIEVRKANESEAEQILIFTEKIISENPECLELTELFRRAENAFASGDYSTAMNLGQEAVEACEEAIEVNEQIRHRIEGVVRDNFYYILFTTLAIFFLGFVFYVYKRVRFNKYKEDEYI